jgi:hypothetical protein
MGNSHPLDCERSPAENDRLGCPLHIGAAIVGLYFRKSLRVVSSAEILLGEQAANCSQVATVTELVGPVADGEERNVGF